MTDGLCIVMLVPNLMFATRIEDVAQKNGAAVISPTDRASYLSALLEGTRLVLIDANSLDPAWLDKYSQRASGSPGKVVMDDFNKLRQMLGLNLMGTGAKVATGVAPPYALDKALVLVTGRKDSLKVGARSVALEVKLVSAGRAVAARNYTKAEILQW